MRVFPKRAVLIGLITASFFASLTTDLLAQARPGIRHLPPDAIEIVPDVYFLGQKLDGRGRRVQGIAWVRRAFPAKPDGVGGNKGGKPDKGGGGSTCYAFISNGAVWKEKRPFVVNPAGSGLGGYVLTSMNAAISRWEVAAGADIFLPGDEDANLTVHKIVQNGSVVMNGYNEVVFAPIAEPGVIAVTYTWGIFVGRPSNRQLVEWDQIYDNDDFAWIDAVAYNCTGGDQMDFPNIATHEIGHAMGLGHPDSTCMDETMFAYASSCETEKRSLHNGDEAGIAALYGP